MPNDLSREEAWNLLCEWTQSESLRRHMLAVAAAMRAYAPRYDGDVELWGLTGLLHDLDYERHPNLQDGHPRYAIAELEHRGYPPELVRAVAAHADFMGVPRETPMEKALYAVDELCGFVLACAYVRPDGLVGMTPKAVKKKLKQPSFARGSLLRRPSASARRPGCTRSVRAPTTGDLLMRSSTKATAPPRMLLRGSGPAERRD